MYLGEFDKEKKELFLDLCINLSKCDGDFAIVEKRLIEKFCVEMNINARFEAKQDTESTLALLNNLCDNREKRAIIIEIIGIVLADEKYHDAEKSILRDCSNVFSVDFLEITKVMDVVKELYGIYGKFNLFLNGECI